MIAEDPQAENHGNTCHMHTQELVLQHELDIRQSKIRGEPFDEFPEGKL